MRVHAHKHYYHYSVAERKARETRNHKRVVVRLIQDLAKVLPPEALVKVVASESLEFLLKLRAGLRTAGAL